MKKRELNFVMRALSVYGKILNSKFPLKTLNIVTI